MSDLGGDRGGESQLYYAMEYIDGEDLYEATSKTRFLFSQQVAIYAKLIFALEDMRRVGLTHNDLRMENILLVNGSIVKIIDFGYSCRDVDLDYFGQGRTIFSPARDYFELAKVMYEFHAYSSMPVYYGEKTVEELSSPFISVNGKNILSHPHVNFNMWLFNALKPLLDLSREEKIGADSDSVIFYIITNEIFNDIDRNRIFTNRILTFERSQNDFHAGLAYVPLEPADISKRETFKQTLNYAVINFEHLQQLGEVQQLNMESINLLNLYQNVVEFSQTYKNLSSKFQDCLEMTDDGSFNCLISNYKEFIRELHIDTTLFDRIDLHNSEVHKAIKK
ncbi:hypothetical protein ROZALSC1DRAFT_30879 [Rozella allomycis CSF55]|uniref:non-specific serine/threonine protein kinase n=1 Tax=Rozella allomycis (strain CSF55) TaxID=988480 RepID=A0A075ANJ1_ROZAC|nr:Tyrosine-protein kinase domain-containing protein [Rozella allomycis CSF55]RKP17295.1 hypothetical protein ROZALSC1DRAFT_30879 [Rozella allomycis CSF55]|eukprot:EPZ31399.1 Tyrosine-protein kinase domain-containing protein [Rozella allomycis CSF55]